MNTFQSISALVLVLTVSLTATAAPVASVTSSSDYGSVVHEASAVRKIVITPGTKWVNVTNGETVTFVVDGRSFTYSFHTYQYTNLLPMAAIAPADLNIGGIRVYVSHPAQA